MKPEGLWQEPKSAPEPIRQAKKAASCKPELAGAVLADEPSGVGPSPPRRGEGGA
ncbi:unnamed protein product [Ciceribacter selenitireducens ATCC BAA-1503]|uniref:Uncharacterized protein n=1 Tax=Ciceribacter selenitireducens ATCC BAA-1503 TaxID=1336235 RepID=A0A376ACP4_9HYPH|nr:unnamed protein product [Ciceribacter selenitireducens ATCC BAA-1503]